MAGGRADQGACPTGEPQAHGGGCHGDRLGQLSALEPGEDRGGLRKKATVLSNTMEAVMGALFLDGGLEPVREFVAASRDGRGGRATGRGTAVRRCVGQLQVGAPGAHAVGAGGNAGIQGQERKRSRPPQAVPGRGPSEGGRRGTAASPWRAARAAPRSWRSRMRRGAHWNG